MGKIPEFQRSRLASSAVGTPGINQSGNIISNAVVQASKASQNINNQKADAFNSGRDRLLQTELNVANNVARAITNSAIKKQKINDVHDSIEVAEHLADFEVNQNNSYSDNKNIFSGNPDEIIDFSKEQDATDLESFAKGIVNNKVRSAFIRGGQSLNVKNQTGLSKWVSSQRMINSVKSFNNIKNNLNLRAKQSEDLQSFVSVLESRKTLFDIAAHTVEKNPVESINKMTDSLASNYIITAINEGDSIRALSDLDELANIISPNTFASLKNKAQKGFVRDQEIQRFNIIKENAVATTSFEDLGILESQIHETRVSIDNAVENGSNDFHVGLLRNKLKEQLNLSEAIVTLNEHEVADDQEAIARINIGIKSSVVKDGDTGIFLLNNPTRNAIKMIALKNDLMNLRSSGKIKKETYGSLMKKIVNPLTFFMMNEKETGDVSPGNSILKALLQIDNHFEKSESKNKFKLKSESYSAFAGFIARYEERHGAPLQDLFDPGSIKDFFNGGNFRDSSKALDEEMDAFVRNMLSSKELESLGIDLNKIGNDGMLRRGPKGNMIRIFKDGTIKRIRQ
jgi:hypothetical protein